jgi:hypothetical protein
MGVNLFLVGTTSADLSCCRFSVEVFQCLRNIILYGKYDPLPAAAGIMFYSFTLLAPKLRLGNQ